MNKIYNNQEVIDDNPILILDFDGVIFAPEYIQTPKEKAISNLNKIISHTNCKIVVSSSHKINYNYNIDIMHQKLFDWGIVNGEIVGFTYGMRAQSNGFNGRENEILHWLNIHKPGNYCAIDDSIRETDNWVDCIHVLGITDHDADRAISWLNNGYLPKELNNIKISQEEFSILKNFFGENYEKYVDIDKLIIGE